MKYVFFLYLPFKHQERLQAGFQNGMVDWLFLCYQSVENNFLRAKEIKLGSSNINALNKGSFCKTPYKQAVEQFPVILNASVRTLGIAKHGPFLLLVFQLFP